MSGYLAFDEMTWHREAPLDVPAEPPIQCQRARWVAAEAALTDRCQQRATWDEIFACIEGTQVGHRCDEHHAEILTGIPIGCWLHRMRHYCELTASYRRE